jgi:hypothetical protein
MSLAKAANIPLFTPREFYTGKLDEAAESMAFLERLQAGAWVFACPPNDPASWQLAMRDVSRYYAHVLLGQWPEGQ